MSSSRRSLALTLAAAVLAAAAASAHARVLYGKKEALEAAFPTADRIDNETHILTDEQVARVRELSGAEVDDKIVTWHIARRGEEILGYAFFETHPVRTLPEALLVVVTPSGKVGNLLLAAFYEPPEYEPSERWLGQFEGAELHADLRVSRRIHGITGATLTARAVTNGVRKVLALHRVLFGESR